MNPRRKKRLTIVALIFFGVAGVSALILFALSQNINLFYTPTEIVKGKEDTGLKPQIGQQLRIGGMVVKGSVVRDTKTLQVDFALKDIGPEVTVRYQGILPDLFREGQGIVAMGTLIAPTIIEASEVLAKHDENYMPKEIAEAMAKRYDSTKHQVVE